MYNPLATSASVQYTLQLTKILILRSEGILKKMSYERRVYKSVNIYCSAIGIYSPTFNDNKTFSKHINATLLQLI